MVDDENLNYLECEILAKMILVRVHNHLSKTELAKSIGYNVNHPYFNRVYKICLNKNLLKVIGIVGPTTIISLSKWSMKNFLWNQEEFQKRVRLFNNVGYVFMR